MKKREIITDGQKFNYLTIIKFSHSDKRGRKWYFTKCDCGIEKVIMGSAMVSENTKSCGCYNKSYRRELYLLPDNLGVKRTIYAQYRFHAIRRKIEFNLNEDDFIDLISKNCYYCDLPPSNVKKTKNYKEGFKYSGIDRVDSAMGYKKENCVPCCENCNKAKLAMSKEDFLNWIERVYNYSIKNEGES